VPIDKLNRDTLKHSLVYEFIFNLRDFLQKTKKRPIINKNGIILLFSLLESKKIDIETKYLVLSAYFVNHKNSSMGDIELNDVFQTIISSKENRSRACKIIDNTLIEFDKLFIDQGKDIYESVENFFYVLYQTWDGETDSKQLLNIKKVSSNKLATHPDAINKWWNEFYYDSNAETFDEILEDVKGARWHHLNKHIDVYISLSDLIAATKKAKGLSKDVLQKAKWWEQKVLKDNMAYKKYIDWQSPINAKDTLHWQLKHQPYYLSHQQTIKPL